MAESSPKTSSRRLVTVDLLRGLAALFVLLYHSQSFFRGTPVANIWDGGIYQLGVEPAHQLAAYLLFGFGFLGVPLFFVISGFCIHLPFTTPTKAMKLGAFGIRRFIRLYPAYLVTCLVGFVYVIAKFGFGEGSATLTNMVGHLVFWHYDYPVVPGGVEFTVVIWSIVIEVHFYILYALLLGGLRRLGMGRAAVIALALGVAYRVAWAFGDFHGPGTVALLEPHRFAIARFGEWLLGAWVAELYATGKLEAWSESAWLGWGGVRFSIAAVLGSVLGIALLGGTQSTAEFPTTLGFTWLLASLLALEVSGRFEMHGRGQRVAIWLGDRSYSLYLVHYLAIGFTGEVCARLLGLTEKFSLGGSPTWLGVTALAVVVALVSADLMYRLIEHPSHQLARRAGQL